MVSVSFVALFTMNVNSVLAQQCNQYRTEARDSSRFDINDNGTVTDIESGLTWQRCVVGQQWKDGACVGEARLLTWKEASALVQSNESNESYNSGNTLWRMPKLNEIAGIVDIRCRAPRIDLAVFPNTSAKPFWTANNAPGSTDEIYTLSFGAEGVSRTLKSDKHYLRLVHGRN